MEQKFRRKTHEIFMILDFDRDGLINPTKLQYQKLKPEMFKLIEPVISELNVIKDAINT